MSSRMIKEELLEHVAPEIYKRKQPKRERKVAEEDVKIDGPRKIKKARKKKPAAPGDLEDPILEFATAPRRPYQWKGRRVARVLRPGVPVIFTPGVKSDTRTYKRVYDEVYGDEDVMDAAAAREGEFSYGKMARYGPAAEVLPSVGVSAPDYLVLDDKNPTPELKPITTQKVMPTKRSYSPLEPTVQVLESKRRRVAENGDDGGSSSSSAQAEVTMQEVKTVTPSLGVQTIDVHVPEHSSPREVVTRLTQAVRQAAPSIPMDVAPAQAPPAPPPPPPPSPAAGADAVMAEAATQPARRVQRRGPRATAPRARRTPRGMMPFYALHPSITPTPGYRGTTFVRSARARPVRRRRRRRRTTAATARARGARSVTYRPVNPILPAVRYHPSIRAVQLL